VLAGSTCRCPATVLPRLPHSLPHPVADTGPRCRPAPPVSRAAPRCPCPVTLPCSPAHLHRERVLLPPTAPPGAIPAPRSDCLTLLRSAPEPELERPSFSTTYAPTSLASPTEDPPPPLRFPSEHHRLRRFTVRPSHPPPLSPFEDTLTFPLPRRHCRVVLPSPPATRAPTPPMNAVARSIPPPPPRCAAARVSSTPDRLARRPPCDPCELTGSTLQLASRAPFPRREPLLRRTGPPGRGPANLSIGRT
jgi:hypothetical protein